MQAPLKPSFVKLFQFLYGAIKSVVRVQGVRLLYEFQFLYGAIKSITTNVEGGSYEDFNSSMVRLKETKCLFCLPYQIHFNSSMVRLKVRCFVYRLFTTQFQFLYGAIKRAGSKSIAIPQLISIPLWCD